MINIIWLEKCYFYNSFNAPPSVKQTINDDRCLSHTVNFFFVVEVLETNLDQKVCFYTGGTKSSNANS